MKTKRIHYGFYQVAHNDLIFNVFRQDNGSKSLWVYVNRDDSREGGEDTYQTKADAVAALSEYLQTRHWVPHFGWCG